MKFAKESADGYEAWTTAYTQALEAWCLRYRYPAERYDNELRIEVYGPGKAAYLQMTWGGNR